ncbi:MAG: 16S rRNA (guanine(966)-N(2))-methyltransferase RsmD [Clostridiales bacterium]|nr:16S rRNA (guanine(966)-N(2))-methyltransferase RsmD [Clostridiales bacterium]
MMMRVITGSARGRRLATLDGTDIIRPTAESVKEAMFSILQFELQDAEVLDLFAGTGQLGIEALSRGAAQCTFVEQNPKALALLRDNLAHCGLSGYVVKGEAVQFLNRSGRQFDIALLDPPYRRQLIDRALPLLVPRRMREDGAILCESRADEVLPDACEGWTVRKIYRYGQTKLTLYRKGRDI